MRSGDRAQARMRAFHETEEAVALAPGGRRSERGGNGNGDSGRAEEREEGMVGRKSVKT